MTATARVPVPRDRENDYTREAAEARREFVRERTRIVGAQGYSFQSLVVQEPCTASRVVRSVGHDTDQLDVIRIKHHSEICSTQVRAVNPSRSERESQTLPARSGRIQFTHQDHDVIET